MVTDQKASTGGMIFLKVKDIVVLAIDRVTLAVGEIYRINRFLRRIGAKSGHVDDGPIEIIVAVYPDAGGEDSPTVGFTSNFLEPGLHGLQTVGTRLRQSLLDFWIEGIKV
jgi:hypothetical protein